MVKIGVDLGYEKTVMYSSKQNGTPIKDIASKKKVPSVLDKIEPTRKYGAFIEPENKRDLSGRRRYFLDSLSDPKNREALFMFIEYLIKADTEGFANQGVCFAINDGWGIAHRRLFRSVLEVSPLNLQGFVSQNCAVASLHAFKNFKNLTKFGVIDCGVSKTTIGIYQVDQESSRMVRVADVCCRFGARHIDEAIIKTIFTKCQLEDDIIYRERILAKIGSIKSALNSQPSFTTTFYSKQFDVIEVEVSRGEIEEIIKAEVSELTTTLTQLVQQNKDVHFELVGGNSASYIFTDLLTNMKVKYSMDPFEAVAHGAALYMDVNKTFSLKTKFIETLRDLVGYRVLVGEENDSSKVVAQDMLFGPETEYGSRETIQVEADLPFEFEIWTVNSDKEFEQVFSKVMVKPVGEITTGSVYSVEVVVNDFGYPEVTRVARVAVAAMAEGDSEEDLPFTTCEVFKITPQEAQALRDEEDRFIKLENDILKASKLKCEFSKVLSELLDWLQENLPKDSGLSSQEYDIVMDVADSYLCSDPSSLYETELQLVNASKERLSFLTQKLGVFEEGLKQQFTDLYQDIETFLGAQEKITPGSYRLKALQKEIKGMASQINVTLDNATQYKSTSATLFVSKADVLKKRVSSEVEEEKKKEALKALQEARFKATREKIEKDSKKPKNESHDNADNSCDNGNKNQDGNKNYDNADKNYDGDDKQDKQKSDVDKEEKEENYDVETIKNEVDKDDNNEIVGKKESSSSSSDSFREQFSSDAYEDEERQYGYKSSSSSSSSSSSESS